MKVTTILDTIFVEFESPNDFRKQRQPHKKAVKSLTCLIPEGDYHYDEKEKVWRIHDNESNRETIKIIKTVLEAELYGVQL